ncbi:phytanoyl-CoA dioxygenase family protein [Paenibacillus sepulcri]
MNIIGSELKSEQKPQPVGLEHLLTARQMASFVTDGYLHIENLVPDELNRLVDEEQRSGRVKQRGYWQNSQYMQQVFNLPQVKGIIQSLVGHYPVYDHSALHIVQPKHLKAQEWHADSIINTRKYGFDIQAFYFAHDAPDEMGPTLVLPGSHLRRVNTSSIGRYKNIVGQKRMVSKAGTMFFVHEGIWHCAQPNHTDDTRYVFKLRLRPGQEQRGLFNTEGYRDEEVSNIIYRGYEIWQGNEGRLDHVARAKLWRYVTGDDTIDVSFEGALSRMNILL